MAGDYYKKIEELAHKLATREVEKAKYIGYMDQESRSKIIGKLSDWHIKAMVDTGLLPKKYVKLVMESELGAEMRVGEMSSSGYMDQETRAKKYLEIVQKNIINRINILVKESQSKVKETDQPKLKETKFESIKSPWMRGIIDSFSCFKLLDSSGLESKNRINLIILDSTLEILFKNYLLFVKKFKKKDIPSIRKDLHKIVKKHSKIKTETWEKIEYYYDIRNDLYHETTGKTITDSGAKEFHDLVEDTVEILFGKIKT